MEIKKLRTEIELRLVDKHTLGEYLDKYVKDQEVPRCMFLVVHDPRDDDHVEVVDNTDRSFSSENFESYNDAIEWIIQERHPKLKRGNKVIIIEEPLVGDRKIKTVGQTGIVLREENNGGFLQVFVEGDVMIDFDYKWDQVELIKDEEE